MLHRCVKYCHLSKKFAFHAARKSYSIDITNWSSVELVDEGEAWVRVLTLKDVGARGGGAGKAAALHLFGGRGAAPVKCCRDRTDHRYRKYENQFNA